MRKLYESEIVTYYELSEEWQSEARDNLGRSLAEASTYIKPQDYHTPGEYVLWDLNEAIPVEDESGVNAAIPWSNACCLYLAIDHDTGDVTIYIKA